MSKKNKNLGNPVVKKAVKTISKKAAQSNVAQKVKNTTSNVLSNAKPLNIILIAALAWYGSKKLKERFDAAKENNADVNHNKPSVETKVVEDKATGKKKIVKVTWYPNQIAASYDSAMGGDFDGTTVQTIMDLAEDSRNNRWSEIAAAYKNQTGTNLTAKLKSELKAREFTAFQSIVNNTTSAKFGSAEILHVIKTTGVPVYNTKLKKGVVESFIWNGSVMGIVTQRVQGTKGGWFYKMSKYPDFLFPENMLNRDYDSVAQTVWLNTGI